MTISSSNLKKSFIFHERTCKAEETNEQKICSEEISHISPKKLSSHFVMAAD